MSLITPSLASLGTSIIAPNLTSAASSALGGLGSSALGSIAGKLGGLGGSALGGFGGSLLSSGLSSLGGSLFSSGSKALGGSLITNGPASQKADVRPISFVLDMGPRVSPVWVPLVVRPEDLTVNEPSRATFHQTLDKAKQGFVDSFGNGLPTITISGHTGWRAPSGNYGADGTQQFIKLRKAVYEVFHRMQQENVNLGKDPADIKLLFADELDRFAYEVFPLSFTLRRSKSRPLLMQYQITLQALGRVGARPSSPFSASGDFLSSLGLSSLSDCLSKIKGFAGSIGKMISGSIGGLAKSFLSMSANVLGVVKSVIGTVKGAIDKVTGSLLGVAGDIMKAGRNLFMAVSAVTSLSSYVKHSIAQVASAFHTAFCLIKNVFKTKKTMANYGDWYGSSTCSSTAGGAPLSPLRNTNAFYLLKSSETSSSIKLDGAAANAVVSAANTDMVLTPPSIGTTTSMMRAISSGVEAIA